MSAVDPISRLDLNLLVALDALLTEQSVTRAAQRLHLSQPALSASLARLRRHFGDELLARRGNNYELTPLASRLADSTTVALNSARRVFESQADWTPKSATREFYIYGSDYAFTTVGQTASRLAAVEAPDVKFRFELHTPTIVDEITDRLRSFDGILIPHGYFTDLSHFDLWTDRWVILADADHPGIGEQLTVEDLAENPWVLTYQSRSAFTSASQQLQSLGITIHVETVVQSFLALPFFIRGTRRIGLIQAALADTSSLPHGIRVLTPPFDAGPVVNALWWHSVHDSDPGHRWMRSIFQQAGQAVANQGNGASPPAES